MGFLLAVRNDKDGELTNLDAVYRERYAVEGDAALFCDEWPKLSREFETEFQTLTGRQNTGQFHLCIDVTRDKMPAKSVANAERTFQVHTFADCQLTKIGTVRGLR